MKFYNIKNQYAATRGLAIILILVLILGSFAACGSSDDESGDDNTSTTEEEQPQGDLQITLSIDFPDGSAMEDFSDKAMALPDEGTVLDLVYGWANENGIEITLEGDEPDQYISAIGADKEGSSAGWTFEVNGEMPMTSAGSTALENGDKVELKYASW